MAPASAGSGPVVATAAVDGSVGAGARRPRKGPAVKVAQLPERAEGDVVFRDGLGVRVHGLTDAGEAVHRLHLAPAFVPVQQAVEDRVNRLANLQHVKFARLRGLERAKPGGSPVVVSAAAEGIRLSDVLLSAGHGLVEVTPGQALQVTRELLAALVVLHDSRNVTHGSLGPERIVLTPHGRVMVVEHVLAQALERLQLPRHHLWREWRIPTPPAAGPVRFDARTDLAQAGLTVLALALGRLIEDDEYPHRLRGLLPAASGRLGRATGTAQARELQAWLERLLPIESRRPFTTVKEAQLAFEALISAPASSLGMSPAKVRGLVSECAALAASAKVPDPATPEQAPSGETASTADAAPIVLAAPSEAGVAVGQPDPAEAPDAAPDVLADTGTGDGDVDVEALLRLAAELEAAGSSEPPSQAEATPVIAAPDGSALPAPFEVVEEEPQEEPSAADVDAVAEEVDLGERLALLTESRPPQPVTWQVSADDLTHIATERDALRQQFADILSLVAPEPAPTEPLVHPTIRWTFEPEPQAVDSAPVTADRDPLTAEPVTVHREPLTAASTPLTSDREPLSADREPRAADRDPLIADSTPLIADRDALTATSEPLAADGEPLLASPQIADDESLAAHCAPLAASSETLGADGEAVVVEVPSAPVGGPLSAESDDVSVGTGEPATLLELGEPADGEPRAAGDETNARAADAQTLDAVDATRTEVAVADGPTAAWLAAPQADDTVAGERATAGPGEGASEAIVDDDTSATRLQAAADTGAMPVVASDLEPAQGAHAAEPAGLDEAVSVPGDAQAPLPVAEAGSLAADGGPRSWSGELSSGPEPADAVTQAGPPDDALASCGTTAAERPVSDDAPVPPQEPCVEDVAVVAPPAPGSHEDESEALPVSTTTSPAVVVDAPAAQAPVVDETASPVTAENEAAAAHEEVPSRASAPARPSKRRRSRRRPKRPAAVQPVAAKPSSTPQVPEPPPAEPALAAAPPVRPDEAEESRPPTPLSLVEREVPAWQPPPDLDAVGAAAAAGRSPRAAVTPDVDTPPDEAPTAVAMPEDGPAPGTPVPTAQPTPGPGTRPARATGLAPVFTPPAVAFDAGSLVPDEYLAPGGRVAGPHLVNADGRPPQVTTVGDPGYGPPPLTAAAQPRTVVVLTSQINWRRTVAAAVLLAVLESAAFAAAWWWVQPGAKGTLVVETSRPGVDVLLDGAFVGVTPYHDDVRPGRHTLTLRHGGLERSMPVEISGGVVTTQTLAWPDPSTGALRVTSSPEGAEVLIGGRVRGRTPLSIDGLAVGRHTLVVRSPSGTVTTTAAVVGGETTAVDVPIFAGWLAVHAPVDLAVSVNGTHVGSSLDGQILLAPGGHKVTVANGTLGFTRTLDVTVEPGKVRTVTVMLPEMPLVVSGEEGGEVFVDGTSRGVLPGEVTVPLGTHEVVLRRQDGSERRRTITVRTGAPVSLD